MVAFLNPKLCCLFMPCHVGNARCCPAYRAFAALILCLGLAVLLCVGRVLLLSNQPFMGGLIPMNFPSGVKISTLGNSMFVDPVASELDKGR
jgi:hypothetical protein